MSRRDIKKNCCNGGCNGENYRRKTKESYTPKEQAQRQLDLQVALAQVAQLAPGQGQRPTGRGPVYRPPVHHDSEAHNTGYKHNHLIGGPRHGFQTGNYKKLGQMCGSHKKTYETFTNEKPLMVEIVKAPVPNGVPNGVPKRVVSNGVIKIASKNQLDGLVKTTSANNQLLVVKCFATWCGPCKSFAPQFKKLATETTDPKVVFAETDVEDKIIKAEAIPNTVIIKDGQPVAEVPGANIGNVKAAIAAAKSR